MACLAMYLDKPDVHLLLSWLNDDPEIAFITLKERKTRPTTELKRLLKRKQGFTFYGGIKGLMHVENHWIAVKRLDGLPDGIYTLWHVPSGPLPLLAGNGPLKVRKDPLGFGPSRSMTIKQALGYEDDVIDNAWAGWIEREPGADPSQPYFGPGHPGAIRLEVETRSLRHLEMENDYITIRRRVCDENVLGLSGFDWIGNHYRNIGHPAHPATEKWWKRLGRRVRSIAKKIPLSGPLEGEAADIYAFPAALAAIQNGMARSAN